MYIDIDNVEYKSSLRLEHIDEIKPQIYCHLEVLRNVSKISSGPFSSKIG